MSLLKSNETVQNVDVLPGRSGLVLVLKSVEDAGIGEEQEHVKRKAFAGTFPD